MSRYPGSGGTDNVHLHVFTLFKVCFGLVYKKLNVTDLISPLTDGGSHTHNRNISESVISLLGGC